MPTNYTDQFYQIDAAYPPAAGTTLNVVNMVVTDVQDDGVINYRDNPDNSPDYDLLDGEDIMRMYPGDTVTIDTLNHGVITYTGVTIVTASGATYFTPLDGQILYPGTFVDSAAVYGADSFQASKLAPPACFTTGVMIETAKGPVAVEDLKVGDLVLTLDHGLQPIRWCGQQQLSARHLAARPALRPVRISAGALGPDLPASDLLVSPQHRILVRSAVARRMFGADEVLVAAKQLTQIDGIAPDQAADPVTYFHILFDRHEIVISNGAPTESMYTGAEALKSVSIAARQEICELFPELVDGGSADPDQALPGARYLVPGRKARQMADRHRLNGKPLLDCTAAG